MNLICALYTRHKWSSDDHGQRMDIVEFGIDLHSNWLPCNWLKFVFDIKFSLKRPMIFSVNVNKNAQFRCQSNWSHSAFQLIWLTHKSVRSLFACWQNQPKMSFVFAQFIEPTFCAFLCIHSCRWVILKWCLSNWLGCRLIVRFVGPLGLFLSRWLHIFM